MSRVAITGASGLLGSNLAAELLAVGHSVIATRRTGTKVAHLADLAIEWRDADLADGAALAKAFAGAEAVFHCAAMVTVKRDVTPEMVDANVTGTERVIAACTTAGVKRLVHTSSVVAIGLTTTGAPSDETARWNFDELGLSDAYAITKHQAEDKVRACSLDAVIVNPTYMFGPRDARPSSGKMIVDVARRRVPSWTPGYNNFVDVRDVARGMLLAWQRGKRGERYILGGHDMTYKQCFDTIARVANVKPPRFKAPLPIAKLLGAWGDFQERRGKDPIVNGTQIRYAYTDKFRFTSARAQKELGYTYGPLEPAITDAIAWFRAHAML
jgi:dihydroflavonol-4-reductase